MSALISSGLEVFTELISLKEETRTSEPDSASDLLSSHLRYYHSPSPRRQPWFFQALPIKVSTLLLCDEMRDWRTR